MAKYRKNLQSRLGVGVLVAASFSVVGAESVHNVI